MKSFPDFASCFGLSSPKVTPVPAEDPDVVPDPTRTSPTRIANMSSTTAGYSSGSSRPWRRALDVIPENPDAAALHHDRGKGNKVNCSAETRPRSGQAKVVTRPVIRSPSHDNNHSGKKSPLIMFSVPAFYPSPLMF